MLRRLIRSDRESIFTLLQSGNLLPEFAVLAQQGFFVAVKLTIFCGKLLLLSPFNP